MWPSALYGIRQVTEGPTSPENVKNIEKICKNIFHVKFIKESDSKIRTEIFYFVFISF